MAQKRRYRMLCPIARGLDRVGDRWSLLILRDLHAGPARFTDLQQGLTGIAPNQLSTRLQELQQDGLVRQREAEFGVRLYELTDLGQSTDALIYALAEFGAQFPPDEELRRPGNLRLIAVPLCTTLQAAVEDDANLAIELWVEGDPFSVDVKEGQVSVKAGEAPASDVSVGVAIEPLLEVWDGELSVAAFAAEHVELRRGAAEHLERFLGWVAAASAAAS